jgi:hypothetical protein
MYGVSYEETPKCVSSETIDYLSIHPSQYRYPWDPSFNIHMYEEQIKTFNQREFDRLRDTVEWLEEIDDIG